MKYLVTVAAEVEVEAENIAQALTLAKRIRIFPGDVVGLRCLKNNRDSVRYRIKSRQPIFCVRRDPSGEGAE